jgi:hypothetical protein
MTFFNSCQGQTKKDSLEQKMFQEIQKSHIDGNVPDQSQFDSLLKRDLEKYFSATFGKVDVKWEFLRDGATQSGVAYPKYYIWTKIYKVDTLISEGAARVAAIEKTNFNVTDFVGVKEIKNNSIDIYTIFPSLVCEKIKSRLK